MEVKTISRGISATLISVFLLLGLETACNADEPLRISAARQQIGQTVTVKGRTGVRLEARETEKSKVYTLRDDYGDAINVSTTGDYPVMGVTLLVTGTIEADGKGVLLLENNRQNAYSAIPWWLFPAIGLLVLAGIGAVFLIVRRRAAAGGGLEVAWGHASVVSGPDRGKSFALRGDRIVVGRGLDPLTAVSFEMDTNVSRSHGLIIRQEQQIFYEDTNSSNGSWTGETRLSANQRVPVTPGMLLRLGPTTVLRIEQAGGRTDVGMQTVVIGSVPGRSEDETRRAGN